MTSHKSSSLNFQTLAREGASLERVLDRASFVRFNTLDCALAEAQLDIRFEFGMIDDRPLLSTELTVPVLADCQWCLDERQVELQICAKTLLAKDDQQAEEWTEELARSAVNDQLIDRDDYTVVVANEIDIDLLGWLEDELLLAWPIPVCTTSACERRPNASYGEVETVQPALSASQEAFAQLKELKFSKPPSNETGE